MIDTTRILMQGVGHKDFLPVCVLLGSVFCAGQLISVSMAAGTVQPLHSFLGTVWPSTPIQGRDAAFYGTTQQGGLWGYGTVYRLTTNGDLTTLASFSYTNGARPDTGVVQGPDGALYGTAAMGGAYSNGTVFRVTTNGQFTTLFSFTGTNGPCMGSYPRGLVVGADGAFYGTTWRGGTNNQGSVFRFNAEGAFEHLVSFYGADSGFCDGLTLGPDGALYGTIANSGPSTDGTVIKVTTNGMWTTLAYFNDLNGSRPSGRLILASDGAMYGTTSHGGFYGDGTVFKCTTGGVVTRLTSFSAASGLAYYPGGTLLELDGAFYGTAYGGFSYAGTIFRMLPDGTWTYLFSFSRTNGYGPSGLIMGADGSIYGATQAGGQGDQGTIYRFHTNGAHSVIASFIAPDGGGPDAGLLQAADDHFYGINRGGGEFGHGTVYRITKDGVLTTLGSFDGTNGARFESALMQASDGHLYGTALAGGDTAHGTVFQVTTNGVIRRLASFSGATDGVAPIGTLVQGPDTALYGVTFGGGNYAGGTVFRITTNGALSRLASLSNPFGANPRAGLIFGRDGALYGTTSAGGTYSAGTVFRVTTNGVLTLIATLNPNQGHGDGSRAPLLLGRDGAFYSTTFYGGTDGDGTLFRVTTNGVIAVLSRFGPRNAASYPSGPLVQGGDGALYGSTIRGVLDGTLYRVTTNGARTILVGFDYVTGQGPASGVILARDGYFYGTTSGGGPFEGGNVFRVALIPRMHPLRRTEAGWLVSFEGVAGNFYRVMRAAKVSKSAWIALASIACGSDGSAAYIDPTPPSPESYYRVAYP